MLYRSDNQGNNITDPLYVNRKRDGILVLKKMFMSLTLIKEYFAKHTNQSDQKIQGKISNHVKSIITEVLGLTTEQSNDIDETSLGNAIGNDRKPFYVVVGYQSYRTITV